MYDVKSPKAEEFISHQEILDTLAYAEENKENRELLDAILAKAATFKGLNHREAVSSLRMSVTEYKEKLFALAKEIKRLSTAIVLFYLHRYTCLTIVSMDVCIVRTTPKTAILNVKN